MIAVLVALGCATGPEGARPSDDAPLDEQDLVDMASWVEPRTDDPFDDAPIGPVCPPSALLLEGASIEVDTGQCTYLWQEQPLLHEIRTGMSVEAVFWHGALVAEGPAEAHLGFAVDGLVVYERTVSIPLDATAYTEQSQVDFDAEAGAVVTFHLHNHGANNWNVLRFTRLAQEER